MCDLGESRPMCILKHGNDQTAHIFKVTNITMKKICDQLPHLLKPPNKPIDLDNVNFFFGLVNSAGLLQIWDLRRRRHIFSIETDVNLYWAEVLTTADKYPKFLFSSRVSGLYTHEWVLEKASGKVEDKVEGDDEKERENPPPASTSPIVMSHISGTNLVNSFNKPVIWQDRKVVVVRDQSWIVSMGLEKTDLPSEPTHVGSGVTLVKSFTKYPDLLLLGLERNELALFDLNSSRKISTLDIAEAPQKNQTDMPLHITCCDGDEESGYFTVGTTQHFMHVIRIVLDEPPDSAPYLKKVNTTYSVGNVGTTQILLHPNKTHVAIAGWDCSLTIYSFPDMIRNHKCDFESNFPIGCLHFITSTELDEDEEGNRKREFSRSRDLVYLAAGTPDGILRIWNLSGW